MRGKVLLSVGLFLITLLFIYFEFPLYASFILIVLTLILGSGLLGDATEEVANYYSPRVGGLLNATLGNLAELIIVFFALQQGLIEVVKASITGSIIGNILLVFGAAIFFGGWKHKEFQFTRHESNVSSTMLLISAFLLLIPSVLFLFNEQKYTISISYIVAIALFVLYIGSMIFSFFTHKEYFSTGEHEKPKMKKSHAIMIMILSIVMLAILSEFFSVRIEEIAHSFNFGELFIGAILIGIVGNAAEHMSAIKFARKNKASLALNVAIGSSLQIAMFAVPILVFISVLLGNPMTLVFLPIEIISILLSVLLVNEISRDGSVNWLEGAQLLVLYIILAVVFFFYG